jgi:hypothetical protein
MHIRLLSVYNVQNQLQPMPLLFIHQLTYIDLRQKVTVVAPQSLVIGHLHLPITTNRLHFQHTRTSCSVSLGGLAFRLEWRWYHLSIGRLGPNRPLWRIGLSCLYCASV